jgi:hypothetical protein
MRRSVAVAAICLALLYGLASGQTKDIPPIRTTVCELMKEPAKFNGKIVQVRGHITSGFEKSFLFDEGCDGRIWFSWRHGTFVSSEDEGVVAWAFIKSESDLRHPDRLKWQPFQPPRPVALEENDSVKALEKYLTEFYGPKPGEMEVSCPPMACPAFAVTATVTGRFDYDPHQLRAIRGKNPGELASTRGGFGHLNMFESQFVLGSVADVVAKPIDRSIYDRKR